MRVFLKICGGIHAACLILLVLLFAVQIPTFGMWFYRWQFGQIGADGRTTYERVGMEAEDLHAVTRHMLRYMRGSLPDSAREIGVDRDFIHLGEPLLQIDTIVDGQPRPFFSDIEIRHMHDVFMLFRGGFILRDILLILLVLTTLAFLLVGRDDGRLLFKAWQYGAAGVAGGLVLLAGLIALNWQRAFHIFHEIFFRNDEWLLDARVDLLVNIVPYSFFVAMTVFIGSFFGIGLLIMFILGKLLGGRGRPYRRSYRY